MWLKPNNFGFWSQTIWATVERSWPWVWPPGRALGCEQRASWLKQMVQKSAAFLFASIYNPVLWPLPPPTSATTMSHPPVETKMTVYSRWKLDVWFMWKILERFGSSGYFSLATATVPWCLVHIKGLFSHFEKGSLKEQHGTSHLQLPQTLPLLFSWTFFKVNETPPLFAHCFLTRTTLALARDCHFKPGTCGLVPRSRSHTVKNPFEKLTAALGPTLHVPLSRTSLPLLVKQQNTFKQGEGPNFLPFEFSCVWANLFAFLIQCDLMCLPKESELLRGDWVLGTEQKARIFMRNLIHLSYNIQLSESISSVFG